VRQAKRSRYKAGHALIVAFLMDGVEWVTCVPEPGVCGRTQPVSPGLWDEATSLDQCGKPTPLYVQRINENKEPFLASI